METHAVSLFDVIQEGLLTVLAVVTPIAVGFLVRWLKALGTKAGITIDVQKEAMLEHRIQSFLLQVEEEAAARIRAGLPKWAPGEKFSRVFEKVVGVIPGISRQEAEELIQANLPKIGLGAIAALDQIKGAATSGER